MVLWIIILNFAVKKLVFIMGKYRNSVLEVCGERFDSRKEYREWLAHCRLESLGLIYDLRRQVSYELLPSVVEEEIVPLKTKMRVKRVVVQRAVHYVADIVYKETGTDKEVVVDVKASAKFQDPVYKLKKKMMRALKGITIKEIY